MIFIGLVIAGIALPPAVTFAWWPFTLRRFPVLNVRQDLNRFIAQWFMNSVIEIFIAVYWMHLPPLAAGHVISAVIAACSWFTRRKLRRGTELLGAKSRALRDALARKMHDRTVPGPAR